MSLLLFNVLHVFAVTACWKNENKLFLDQGKDAVE